MGYQVKTTSPDAWQLEHKFTVPGVGTADAALGEFPDATAPTVVIELKGAMTDLDRDPRSLSRLYGKRMTVEISPPDYFYCERFNGCLFSSA